MENIKIRQATVADAEAILGIYSYYVEKTVITYEYLVPTIEEFRQRIDNTLKKYPYLVMESEGRIVGYAYAGVFKARAAYDWACELTIYMAHGLEKKGMGKRLYDALQEELVKMGMTNLYACIAYPDENDEYLTKNSAEFHEHMGFRLVGEFKQCGYKFGRWYNMVWMEKHVGDHVSDQKPIVPYPQVQNPME